MRWASGVSGVCGVCGVWYLVRQTRGFVGCRSLLSFGWAKGAVVWVLRRLLFESKCERQPRAAAAAAALAARAPTLLALFATSRTPHRSAAASRAAMGALASPLTQILEDQSVMEALLESRCVRV